MPGREHPGHPVGAAPAASDHDERPDDDPHHVVEESISLHLDPQFGIGEIVPPPAPAEVEPVDCAHFRQPGGGHRLETGEIVLPHQRLRRDQHGFEIEARLPPPDEVPGEHRAPRGVVDPVAVDLADGPPDRIEARGGLLPIDDRHVRGEPGIDGPHPGAGVVLRRGFK